MNEELKKVMDTLSAAKERSKVLEDTRSSKKPICNVCKTELRPCHYIGYYESFYYWQCQCEKLENAEEDHGQFA